MQVRGVEIEVDGNGFMRRPLEWTADMAAVIAADEGIPEMSDRHWAVVTFIREYWLQHDLAPPVRLLCQKTGLPVRELYKLFRSGPAKGACRIAGLPRPDGCV